MPWVLHSQEIDLYLRGPVGRLSDVLKAPRTSEFEEVVLAAVGHYSRAALRPTPHERLVDVLVTLESLLLGSEGGSIQRTVAERLAFAVGKNVEARKAIMECVKKAYGLRSRFLHHGKTTEETEVLRRFLWHAWEFMFAVVDWTKSFPTKTAFLDAIEHRKLS